MKLVIDRQKWLRGEGTMESFLLRKSDGKQCCVGIYAEACGVSRKELENAKCASWISKPPASMRWLLDDTHFDSTAAYKLYNPNDRRGMPEPEREAKISAEFAKHGVEVEFIN